MLFRYAVCSGDQIISIASMIYSLEARVSRYLTAIKYLVL